VKLKEKKNSKEKHTCNNIFFFCLVERKFLKIIDFKNKNLNFLYHSSFNLNFKIFFSFNQIQN